MADKTTTLKTKTGDNVYPKILGESRDNAISDSPQIKHTLTAEHKINFRLDTNVNNLINNSLQKPSGLTKTELVGVGANGQENIEIGDNLTLANGKLSATGGGSSENAFDVITSTDGSTYTGTISGTKPVLLDAGVQIYVSNTYTSGLAVFNTISISEDNAVELEFMANNGTLTIKQCYIQRQLYSHFITLTSNTSTFYLTYQNTSDEQINTFDYLKTALGEKCLLCTGHTNTEKAEYISVKVGNIVVGVVDNSNNSTRGITIDSSFTISDLVTTVN